MGVKIEVFRMMLYLSFPVTMFWISNQAEYFEEYIVKRKREIFPPDEESQRKELEDFKERMRVRKEQRLLKNIPLESENWKLHVEENDFPPSTNDTSCGSDFEAQGKKLDWSMPISCWKFLLD